MIVQSACQASSKDLATENLGRPKCPCCGSVLLVAEGSRFNSRGRIDHDWSCDNCGHEFATSVRLLPY
jgi:predicted RNA-binding Zn-ribbon protein involved in translation (DUF1610 family)